MKKTIAEFKGKMSTEIRRQKILNAVKEKNFKRRKLLRKYIVKMLYG